MSNDRKDLLTALGRQGWRIDRGGHHKCFAPNGKDIVVLSASGQGHGLHKDLARIRRADPNFQFGRK